jgi:hypothetical protein
MTNVTRSVFFGVFTEPSGSPVGGFRISGQSVIRSFLKSSFFNSHFAPSIRRSATLIVVSIAGLLSAGCASLQGAPRRNVPDAFDVGVFKLDPSSTIFSQDWSLLATDDAKQSGRNDFITARMYSVDRAYNDYERNILTEARKSGFGSTFLALVLTTTGTAVASKGAKTALAAAATGVIGGKQAFDKEILLDRTIQVLQSQMRASRAATKVRILSRLDQPYRRYTIGLAMSDLEDYYQAGTLSGALVAASESAAAATATAQFSIDAQLVSKFDNSPTALLLSDYFGEENLTDAEWSRRKALGVAELTAMGVPATVTPLIFADQTRAPDLKMKFIEGLIKRENNPQGSAILKEILAQIKK